MGKTINLSTKVVIEGVERYKCVACDAHYQSSGSAFKHYRTVHIDEYHLKDQKRRVATQNHEDSQSEYSDVSGSVSSRVPSQDARSVAPKIHQVVIGCLKRKDNRTKSVRFDVQGDSHSDVQNDSHSDVQVQVNAHSDVQVQVNAHSDVQSNVQNNQMDVAQNAQSKEQIASPGVKENDQLPSNNFPAKNDDVEKNDKAPAKNDAPKNDAPKKVQQFDPNFDKSIIFKQLEELKHVTTKLQQSQMDISSDIFSPSNTSDSGRSLSSGQVVEQNPVRMQSSSDALIYEMKKVLKAEIKNQLTLHDKEEILPQKTIKFLLDNVQYQDRSNLKRLKLAKKKATMYKKKYSDTFGLYLKGLIYSSKIRTSLKEQICSNHKTYKDDINAEKHKNFKLELKYKRKLRRAHLQLKKYQEKLRKNSNQLIPKQNNLMLQNNMSQIDEDCEQQVQTNFESLVIKPLQWNSPVAQFKYPTLMSYAGLSFSEQFNSLNLIREKIPLWFAWDWPGWSAQKSVYSFKLIQHLVGYADTPNDKIHNLFFFEIPLWNSQPLLPEWICFQAVVNQMQDIDDPQFNPIYNRAMQYVKFADKPKLTKKISQSFYKDALFLFSKTPKLKCYVDRITEFQYVKEQLETMIGQEKEKEKNIGVLSNKPASKNEVSFDQVKQKIYELYGCRKNKQKESTIEEIIQ